MRGRLHPLRQNPEATHCPATRSLRSHTGLPGGGPAVPGVPGARCENKATSRISRQTAQSRLTSTSERGSPRTALPRARDVLFSPHRASEDSPWPQSVTRLQPHSRPAGVCTNASWARRRTHARHRRRAAPSWPRPLVACPGVSEHATGLAHLSFQFFLSYWFSDALLLYKL